jgi:asparagine synthase (glutamine-hydrolysing)
MAPRLRPLAWLARPIVERLPSSSGKVSFDYKAKRFVRGARLPALERHHAWKEIFSPDARAELGCSSGYDPLEVYRRHFERTAGAKPLVRMQEMDLNVYLVDDLLVKTDRASMAHSLEARVPFLDTQVSDLALALPTSMKVRGFAKKRLLRRAMAPLVPKEIVQGKKQGFSIPAAAWLRGELEPFAREVLSPETLRRQGYFRPETVSAMIDTHVSRREDLSRQLWGLLTFTLWHERWVEAPAGEPARAANPTL